MATALACLAAMLAGCAEKAQPELHPLRPQPPVILFSWHNSTTGENGDTGAHSVPSQFFLPVGLDESLGISIKASDNGGLFRISFSGWKSWKCSDGTPHEQDLPSDNLALHPALESIALPITIIALDNWECPPGSVVIHGSAYLDGHAVGYASRQNQAQLNVDFVPKASP